MKFKFNFHHMDPSQSLIAYSQDEIEKVARHLLADGSCQVFYRTSGHECQIQVDINSGWGHFKATAKGETYYVALDNVAEKLGKQFKKTKEKHQNHKKAELSKEGRLKRVNSQLEYDPNTFLVNKKAS